MNREGENVSNTISRDLDNNQTNKTEKTPKILFLLFSYLYFVQGAIMGISGTMPYIYPTLPGIHTMALFNSVSLPYSFKFLFAPFLEKHTSIAYGKRKTWIIISQLVTGCTLFLGSFFTSEDYAQLFAILCILMMFGMVLQNIALHSLIVKQIRNAHESSMIQSWSEVFGILVGALILLKFTSKDFAAYLGYDQPLSNPQTVITIFCFLILIPLYLIHLSFQQRTLQSEKRGTSFTFWQILSYYKIFKEKKTKYFRFCVVNLIYNQGLNFFNSLYDYQLAKAGFSRDTMNTISNIVIIPTIFLTFYFSSWTRRVGQYQSINISIIATIILNFYILLFFPLNPLVFGIYNFMTYLLDAWRFFVFGVVINQFPIHALSGMYITLLGSFYNFGRLTTIHTQLCGFFGWRFMSWIGLFLQIGIIFFLKRLWEWMDEGDVGVPKEIEEKKEFDEQQMQEGDVVFH